MACAALVAAYMPKYGMVNLDKQLDVISKWPRRFCAIMSRAASVINSVAEKKFTSNISRISAVDMSCTAISAP